MSPPKKSIVERLALDEPAQAVAIGAPHIEAHESHDDLDINLAIVRFKRFDYSLGSAYEQIAEGSKLTGAARRGKLERAMRYLAEEIAAIDKQAAATALVMIAILPAAAFLVGALVFA